MSGLGTTVAPEGAPGSGTAGVRPQAESVPDNPATIVQSTAIQTLDQLLHDNWIYDSTFTVSTNMPAGTVVYTKPIHPLEWNWPNKRVASMFNIWTGSGKIRYRPLATAWYGGSIRVGFLPPNISAAGVRKLPLELLTSYPNRDIDPKNTDWVDFRGPDQREIAYHYLKPFDTNDHQSFGGYIVFYVAGKLVTQSPEFTTIQFVVETAGDFLYDQPSPSALDAVIGSDDPVGILGSMDQGDLPLCDSMSCGVGQVLQVLAQGIQELSNPPMQTRMVGVNRPVQPGDPGVQFASQDASKAWRDSADKRGNSRDSYLAQGNETQPILYPIDGMIMPLCYEDRLPITSGMRTDDGAQIAMQYMVSNVLTIDTPSGNIAFNNTHPQLTAAQYPPGDTDKVRRTMTRHTDHAPIDTTKWFSNATQAPQATMKPMASGESIVIFANIEHRSYAVHPLPFARAFAKWPTDETSGTDSWLYNLINAQGTPLLTIRLNPNGVFSTNASSSAVLYPLKDCTLRFVGVLPISSPLPPVTQSARLLRKQIVRAIRDGDYSTVTETVADH